MVSYYVYNISLNLILRSHMRVVLAASNQRNKEGKIFRFPGKGQPRQGNWWEEFECLSSI